jgi:heavy metal sensor kinase
MSINRVRLRLTVLYSALLALFVTAFAFASYSFLSRTELKHIDLTLHEQSEIVTHVLAAAGRDGQYDRADSARILAALHDLRAAGIRTWIFDRANRTTFSTAMVNEGEGPGEERFVLGDTVAIAALRVAARQATTAAVHATVSTQSGAVRLYGQMLPPALGGGVMIVSYRLRDLHDLLVHARNAAVMAVFLALLVSIPAGYLLARESLDAVAQMSAQADRIGAENLYERLPVLNANDELGRLARTFNALLDRVANAFEQQRRFMADASHELRTPVAIMRGEAEVALSEENRTRDEYRDALEIVRDAGDRLTRTVNDVFLLARVDAGQVPLSPAPMYLDEVVAETCRAMRSLAKPRGIEVVVDVPGEQAYVGDEALLVRLLMNLVDNAIKYSDGDGTVAVTMRAAPTVITLTVGNGGPGIPEAARPRVFDRFYRADDARVHTALSDGAGTGSGLGLAIARWIAEVHGGSLDLTTASSTRTVFTVSLPRQPLLVV